MIPLLTDWVVWQLKLSQLTEITYMKMCSVVSDT